jgi:hypothetical protein
LPTKTGAIDNPGTMGLKRKDFSAMLAIANQRVKDGYAYKDVSQTEPKDRKDAQQKLLDHAKECFKQASEAESSIRNDALDDLKFFEGEQWDDAIKRARQMDQRPCLTINRLPQFVRQITNEQRQNRPSVQVNPVDDGADVETAEIIQGLIRHIEYDSGADSAYDTAFFGAACFSFGYWRVTTEYSDPLSFEQDIKIKRIRNPFTVYYDPHAKEADFSDAEWAFVVETMGKETFRKLYPDAELSQMEDWTSVGDGWVDESACRVAEYFWKDREPAKIIQTVTGEVMEKDEFNKVCDELGISVEQRKSLIQAERDTELTKIKWAKINGIEVLEETEWAGRWIPIVKVVGDEFDIDGKLVLKGIVRDAKEPQRQFNFMKSAATEAIALAPKAPFVAAEGQLEGREREWGAANQKSFAFLQYKQVSLNGTPAPPPQRMNAEPAIQAITAAMMESADDLKAVTGIYDASLGAQGNETSGKAILARQQQAQGANFHYLDNLTRAMRHTGRILLDLIPKIYDTPRVIRIIGEDGSPDMAAIGQQDQITPDQAKKWETYKKIYDLGLGKYDVTVSTGPSYQSRRQEAVSSMLDLIKADPQVLQIAGDLLVKNMDWPGSQDIAKRLKLMLPPAIQQAENNESTMPPEAQQAIAQLTQQSQQLQQQLQQAQQDLQNGLSAKKLETESRERIQASQARIREAELALEAEKVALTALQIQVNAATAQIKTDAQASADEAKLAHAAAMKDADHAHQIAMAGVDHQRQMEMSAQQPEEEQSGEQV